MRRCFTLLTVLVLCASSGCDDKNKEEVADVIVLSRSSVAFAQKGGTTTVAVATPSDWKVSCPDDWVTLASEEGLLTISAASNTTDNVRNSKITVETAGDKQEIAVHQAFSWETVLLSTTASEEISLDSEGESVLFTVVSNGQWSVTSDADWVSVESDPVSGTVRVGAPRNHTATRRSPSVRPKAPLRKPAKCPFHKSHARKIPIIRCWDITGFMRKTGITAVSRSA